MSELVSHDTAMIYMYIYICYTTYMTQRAKTLYLTHYCLPD